MIKKSPVILLFVIFLVLYATAQVPVESYIPANKRLLPKPVETENIEATFGLRNANWEIGNSVSRFPLEEFLKEIGLPLVESGTGIKNAFFGIYSDFLNVKELEEVLKCVPEHEDGYYLEVTEDRVIVIGHSQSGAFYGVQTLKQLLELDPLILVGVRIVDYPALKYRAITDDISRGPITNLEFMKKIVKTMSEFKLNMYSPYMELHVLEGIRSEEETISAKDYRELVEFAKDYHVEIVPSLQTFGHSTSFLTLSNYKHLGNLPSGSSQLDPTNPEVYEFLEEQISKWISLTDSKFINIGGDETWELGSGNSGIEVAKYGAAKVYLDHTLKVMEIVIKNGKIPLFWGDMALEHPEIIEKLPKEAIVLNWHYGDTSSMDRRLSTFESKGKTQWAAPGIDNWLRIFPFYAGSNNNVNSFAKIGTKFGIEGLFTTTWDDDGDTLFGNNWYGVIFASEAAWKGGGPGTSFLNARFDKAVFGEELGIADAIMKLSYSNYYTYKGYFNNSNVLFLKDPFVDLEIYELAANAGQLTITEEQVLKTLGEAKLGVKRNSHILDTLGFTARKIGTFGRKLKLTKEVIDTVTLLEGTEETDKLYELAQKLFEFEVELRDIYEEFSVLYLEENKGSFLSDLKQRYFSLRASIFQKAMELENASYSDVVPSPESIGLPRSPKKR